MTTATPVSTDSPSVAELYRLTTSQMEYDRIAALMHNARRAGEPCVAFRSWNSPGKSVSERLKQEGFWLDVYHLAEDDKHRCELYSTCRCDVYLTVIRWDY